MDHDGYTLMSYSNHPNSLIAQVLADGSYQYSSLSPQSFMVLDI